jgi:hypothetical protein
MSAGTTVTGAMLEVEMDSFGRFFGDFFLFLERMTETLVRTTCKGHREGV